MITNVNKYIYIYSIYMYRSENVIQHAPIGD